MWSEKSSAAATASMEREKEEKWERYTKHQRGKAERVVSNVVTATIN